VVHVNSLYDVRYPGVRYGGWEIIFGSSVSPPYCNVLLRGATNIPAKYFVCFFSVALKIEEVYSCEMLVAVYQNVIR